MSVEQKVITELTDILDQDIETIVSLRLNAERKVSRHQRVMKRATGKKLTMRGRYTFPSFLLLGLLRL